MPISGALSAAERCSPDVVANVMAPASPETPTARLGCDLTLKPQDVLTKALRVEAGDVMLDCMGALLDGGAGTVNAGKDILEIRSVQNTDGSWRRPESVTVRNCRIVGSMRIYGMAVNGEGPKLRGSSRLPGHVGRAQAAAPRKILLDKLHITGTGRIPLYLSPGVTEVTLRDSVMDGLSNSTGIYLDAETMRNVIENNTLAVDARREQIAVDGSSRNLIRNNEFDELGGGGIFLYRNCGEGGTVRHTTPSYNRIVDNRFRYQGRAAEKPAIHVGSRNGSRLYCGLDDGYPFGSSADDRDFATHNTVQGNRFVDLRGGAPIRTGGAVDRPNDIQQP